MTSSTRQTRMSEADLTEIAAFVKERDEMLLALDVDRMLAFHKKHSPNIPPPSNREIAEMSIHKARTAAKSLPMEARVASYEWLTARGLSSMDDGDLAGRSALASSGQDREGGE